MFKLLNFGLVLLAGLDEDEIVGEEVADGPEDGFVECAGVVDELG